MVKEEGDEPIQTILDDSLAHNRIFLVSPSDCPMVFSLDLVGPPLKGRATSSSCMAGNLPAKLRLFLLHRKPDSEHSWIMMILFGPNIFRVWYAYYGMHKNLAIAGHPNIAV